MPNHTCRLDQTHDCRCSFAAAQRPNEQPVGAASAHSRLSMGTVPSSIYRASEPQRFVISRSFGHKIALCQHLGMQCIEYWRPFFLTYPSAIFVSHISRLPFDFVQPANRVKHLLGRLAFVGRMQIKELSAGMRHTGDFSDNLLEACFVPGDLVAHQLAIPLAKEVARIFDRTSRAEVINHCLERQKRRSAVSLDVGTMGFLLALREHLHQRFCSVDHALGKYRFA